MLTIGQYRDLHDKQDGLCAACHLPASGKHRLHIDHDHSTGAIRGLLCAGCNSALGAVNDDVDRLLALVEYLRSAPRQPDEYSGVDS